MRVIAEKYNCAFRNIQTFVYISRRPENAPLPPNRGKAQKSRSLANGKIKEIPKSASKMRRVRAEETRSSSAGKRSRTNEKSRRKSARPPRKKSRRKSARLPQKKSRRRRTQIRHRKKLKSKNITDVPQAAGAHESGEARRSESRRVARAKTPRQDLRKKSPPSKPDTVDSKSKAPFSQKSTHPKS